MTGPKLCECGCGQPAPLARKTETAKGRVKGQPSRFIRGHNPSPRPQTRRALLPTPDPSTAKLCECGCGRPAPIAQRNDRRLGVVRGQPRRFIRGHAGGVQSEAYAEELLHRTQLLVGAVHDDGPDQLRAHLAATLRLKPPPGVDPVEALVTVLAAQIDPDTTAEQRLGWVRAFDRGAEPAPTPPRQLPVRASPHKENAA